MEVEPDGTRIFRNVSTLVPADTRRFPDHRLTRDLTRVGMHPSHIRVVQEEFKRDATRVADISADLITPPSLGSRLHEVMSVGDPKWGEYGLDLLQGTVTDAVMRTVGEGWYRRGRMFFDGLVMDARRVAVITSGHLGGEGILAEGAWLLADGEFCADMKYLVRSLEASGRYGAIVADVKNPRGQAMRITHGIPFFYRSHNRYMVHNP